MKNILLRLAICLVVPGFALLSACGGDDESEADRVKKLLMAGNPWTIEGVTVGGDDETDMFEDMTMTFSNQTLTTANASPVWDSSDTWVFVDESAKAFRRGDGIIVTITSVTEESLVIAMEWDETTLGSGRDKSIAGDHIFTFTR